MKIFLAQVLEKPPTQPIIPADKETFWNILEVFLAIIGALAFLMIVIAGIMLVVSSGDPSKTARARSAIVYSAVGLAVASGAFLIVEIVIKNIL